LGFDKVTPEALSIGLCPSYLYLGLKSNEEKSGAPA